MKTCIAIMTVVCALAGTALAQDDESTDTSTDTSGEVSGEASADVSGGGSASADVSMGGGASGPGGYKMAIGASLNGAGDLPVAHLLYALGANYLDASIGLLFSRTAPDEGDAATNFEISLGVGYRMYKAMANRIHPYLMPYGRFALAQIATPAGPGQFEADTTLFGVGAQLGVDFQLFDQFTLGTALGGEFDFTINDASNNLSLFLYTTSINATFWW